MLVSCVGCGACVAVLLCLRARGRFFSTIVYVVLKFQCKNCTAPRCIKKKKAKALQRTARSLETPDTLTTRSTWLAQKAWRSSLRRSFRLSRCSLGDLLHQACKSSADEVFEGVFFALFPISKKKSAESSRQCGDDPAGGNFHADRSSNGSCGSRRALQLMDAGALTGGVLAAVAS